jgi:hypothetical protein
VVNEEHLFGKQNDMIGGAWLEYAFIATGMARFSFWWISWEVLGVTDLHTRKGPELFDFYAHDT